MRARVSPPFICLSENPNVSPFHCRALSPLACWNLHHRAFAADPSHRTFTRPLHETFVGGLPCGAFSREPPQRPSSRDLFTGPSSWDLRMEPLSWDLLMGPWPLDGTFVVGPPHKTFVGGPSRGTFTKGPSLASLLQGAFFSWPYSGP